MNLALFHTGSTTYSWCSASSLPARPVLRASSAMAARRDIDGGELQFIALLGTCGLRQASASPGRSSRARSPGGRRHARFAVHAHPGSTASSRRDLPIPVGFGALEPPCRLFVARRVWFAYDRASLARQNAYGLLNAMLTATFMRTGMEVSLWGHNCRSGTRHSHVGERLLRWCRSRQPANHGMTLLPGRRAEVRVRGAARNPAALPNKQGARCDRQKVAVPSARSSCSLALAMLAGEGRASRRLHR